MGRDPLGVERQNAQLGWRAANEAADEQEILRLLGCQRLFSAPPRAIRQSASPAPTSSLAPAPGGRARTAQTAAAADEEGFPPAGLHHRSDQADLEPAQPLQPAQALDDVLERFDAIS